MARIEASTVIEAPVKRVWDVLIDWEAQPGWMVDARSVTVLSPHREGLDVVLSCRTAIAGGLVVTDRMVTTEWLEHSSVGVRHLGRLIRGIGAFDLEPTPLEPTPFDRFGAVRRLGEPSSATPRHRPPEFRHMLIGTRFVWWEELDPPLGPVGELVAGAVVVPLVARVFRSSLARLKALCEAGE